MCGVVSWVARHGWGLGAVRKAGCKAGNKVGCAPWNIPAVGLGGDGETGPRGIFRHLDALKGHNFFGTNSRIIRQFLIILEYFSLKVTFGKDEVSGSNPDSSSKKTAFFV